MELFLLMWAFDPTDTGVQYAFVAETHATYAECEEKVFEYKATLKADEPDHLFCIDANELNALRTMEYL